MAGLAAGLPPALLIVLVYLWGVDVPYWDQWSAVPLIGKLFDGRLALADLWSQHYDHRIFFPRLIAFALALLSGWNVRWEMAANVVLAGGLFVVVTGWLRATGARQPWLVAPAVSLIVFNLSQWENWAWGQQMVFFVNAAAVVGGLRLLARGADQTKNLAAAAALGCVASYSFANGLLFWPLSLPLVLLPRERRGRRAAAWLLVAGAVVGFYFFRYSFPAESSLTLPGSFPDAARFAAYVAVFLGAPIFAYDGKLAGLGGLVALPAFAVIIVRLERHKALGAAVPWIVLAGYGVGSGVFAAAGRLQFGLELALSSRYISAANFFWLGLLGLTLVWLDQRPSARGWNRLLLRAAAALAALSLTAGCFWGGVLFRQQYLDRTETARAILEGRLEQDLPLLYPGNRIPSDYIEILRRHRLSLFRQNARAPGLEARPRDQVRDPSQLSRPRAIELSHVVG